VSFALPFAQDLLPPEIWVVSATPEAWVRTREAVADWTLHVIVDWRPELLQGGACFERSAPHLLVVDGGAAEAQVQQLAQQAARHSEPLDWMAFADGVCNPPYVVWPWRSLKSMLAQWLEQYTDRSSLALDDTWVA
jgi:hypothetical protein